MGNANVREDGVDDHLHAPPGGAARSNGDMAARVAHAHRSTHVASSEFMSNAAPPASSGRSVSPILFSSQVPVTPLQRGNGPSSFMPQTWNSETIDVDNCPAEKGIPTMITWIFGGKSVFVEGSWDNWTSRRMLQRSGKDFSILLVLPAGIYHYKFIVDGEGRYNPELPFVSDETGNACNILDVNDYVPDNLQSISEFETPSSPESSYGDTLPSEDEFAKEPLLVPSQLHLTVLGLENSNESRSPSSPLSLSTKPEHVVLNHLFIEKGWPTQSVVAMGLTHRFESKYVTVVLYKPLKK